MKLDEAVRIFSAALSGEAMPLGDIFRINEAAAVIAKEYLALQAK